MFYLKPQASKKDFMTFLLAERFWVINKKNMLFLIILLISLLNGFQKL